MGQNTISLERKPVNNITIRATAELLDFLRSLPNPKGIPYFNIIAGYFVSGHKEAFIEMFGQKSFDEHMEKYERSGTEMKKSKLERDKQKQEQLEEKLKLKKKELELKEKELDIRQQNSSQRSNSETNNLDDLHEEIGEKRKELKNLKYFSEDAVQKQYGKSSREVEQDLIIEVEVLDKKITEISERAK